jgi:ABC-type bacteriocin/lantibiotic exporter with double-glycine peptidase domain
MSHIRYILALLRFSFSHNPIILIALLISLGSVFLELMAMTVLMPLAAIATGQSNDVLNLAPVRWIAKIGFPSEEKYLLIIFILLFSLRVITQFISQITILYSSKRLLHQLATNAFQTLLTELSILEVERKSIGFYISLVGDESFRASSLIANLSQLVTQSTLAALYFFAIYFYSTSAAIAVALFLLITLGLMGGIFRLTHRLGNIQIEQSHAANTLYLDALNGLRSVKSLSAELFISNRYRHLLRNYMGTLFRIDALNLFTRLFPALVLLTASVIFIRDPSLLGPEFVEFGFAITMVIFLMRFLPVVGQVLNIALRVVADARSGRDVTALIRKHKIAPVNTFSHENQRYIEHIKIQDVSFSYNPEKKILSKVSLDFFKGKSYAIIGLSGSGKSTLMDIILGFAQPDSGQVCLNGLPLNVENAKKIIRGNILLVSQETTIFNDTVRNNICFGLDISDDDIRWALSVAQANEFISDLPEGLNTRLTYRGTNLSGGQRQRIGIARALVRRPSVLLLDESTSAIDSETRNLLIKALRVNWGDGILVFVTHDPVIAEMADVIIDMSAINLLEI